MKPPIEKIQISNKSLLLWSDIIHRLHRFHRFDMPELNLHSSAKSAGICFWARSFLYHRTKAEAQVRPPPNASNSRRLLSLILPSRTASSSAMGMEAAEVLPYLGSVSTTFSLGMLGRRPMPSMLR